MDSSVPESPSAAFFMYSAGVMDANQMRAYLDKHLTGLLERTLIILEEEMRVMHVEPVVPAVRPAPKVI